MDIRNIADGIDNTKAVTDKQPAKLYKPSHTFSLLNLVREDMIKGDNQIGSFSIVKSQPYLVNLHAAN